MMTSSYTPSLLALAAALAAVSAFAQAPNDTRATAISLTADRGFCNPTVGTTAAATASGPIASCAPDAQTAAQPDLWYSFVASEPEMTVYAEIDDGNNNTLTAEVTDAAGALVDCATFSYSEAVRRLDSLSAGDIYFIQLSHTAPGESNVVKVCAYETPACLPVENVRTQNGQNWTTVTWSPEGAAPAGGYRVVVGPRRTFDPANDTPIAAADVAPGQRPRVTIWDLEPGVAYDFYVQAVCSDTERSAFVKPVQNFTQIAAGTPPNDSLTAGRGPQTIGSASSGCFGQPGSTRFATSGDGEVGACAAAGPDVWYELTFSAPRYTFELASANGTTADLALEAYDAFGERVACVNATGPGGPETLTLSESEVPPINGRSRVRLRVISADRADSDFFICGYRDAPAVLDPDGCALPVITSRDGTGAPGVLVDVLTDEGQIICAIDNSQDLGQVAIAVYGHSGDLRTAGAVPFADRNISIRVERQPTAPVLVRLYLSAEDIAALVAAGIFPTDGQTRTDQLLAVARALDGSCSETFPGNAAAAEFVGAGPYVGGAYYVDVRVPGFSEFFFSDLANPLPTTVTGLTEVKIEQLEVYPNPTSHELQVALPQNPTGTIQEYDVAMLDATGRRVRSVLAEAGTVAFALDVSDLPAGLYTLHVTGLADGRLASAMVSVRR